MKVCIKSVLFGLRNFINNGGDKSFALSAVSILEDRLLMAARRIEDSEKQLKSLDEMVTGGEWGIGDLLECATREKDIRIRVYPNWIHKGTISGHKASSEIAKMTGIETLLANLQSVFINDEPEAQLTIGFDEVPPRGNTIMLLLKDRSLLIDGLKVKPDRSQGVWNHSPDGFMWGYAGSGPAQLALAILLEFAESDEIAIRWHQSFKREILQGLDTNDSHELVIDVPAWLARRQRGEVQS